MDTQYQTEPTPKNRLPLFIAGGAVLVAGLAIGVAVWRSRTATPITSLPPSSGGTNVPPVNGEQPTASGGEDLPTTHVPGMTTGDGTYVIETPVSIPEANTPEFDKDYVATAAEKGAWGYPVEARVVYRWSRSQGGAAIRVIVSAPDPVPQQIPEGERPEKKPAPPASAKP